MHVRILPLAFVIALVAANGAGADIACRDFAASHPAPSVDLDLVERGDFDVDGDRKPDHVVPGVSEGTMRRATYDVEDAHGRVHRLLTPFFDEGGGYVGYWYVRHGRGYLVAFADEDAKYIGGIFELSAKYEFRRVCAFENEVRRLSVPQRPRDKSICEAADAELPPDPDAPASRPDTAGWRFKDGKLFGPPRAMSFDDADTMTSVVPVDVESGGGRGCDYDYFELADDADTPVARHQRELLKALQEREDYSDRPWACPNTRHSWFKLDGRTYLRSRPAAVHVGGQFDDADRVDGVVDGVPRRICSARYSVTWKLKS